MQSAIDTALAVCERYVAAGKCALVFDLGLSLVEQVDQNVRNLFAVLIPLAVGGPPSDWARLSYLGLLHVQHAHYHLAQGNVSEMHTAIQQGQSILEQCGNETGTLEASFLKFLAATVLDPSHLGGSDGQSKELFQLFEKAEDLQYYQLQRTILRLQESSPDRPNDAEHVLNLCYAWKDVCSRSGHQMSTHTIAALANFEVMQTDDVFEVLDYCNNIDEALARQHDEGSESIMLRVRTLAYSRLESHSQAIHYGQRQIARLRSKRTELNQDMFDMLIAVQQSYVGLLSQADISNFKQSLQELENWLDAQMSWLSEHRQVQIVSLMALSLCMSLARIYKFNFDPYRQNSDITLVPTLTAMRKYFKHVTSSSEGQNVDTLILQGEMLTLEGRFQEAIDLLSRGTEGQPFMQIGDAEGRQASVQYTEGIWRSQDAELTGGSAGLEMLALAISNLQFSVNYWQAKMEKSGRPSDLGTLISSHYFMGIAYLLRGRFTQKLVSTEEARDSFTTAYASFVKCTEMIDTLGSDPHANALDSYIQQTQILAQGRVSFSHVLNAALCVSPNERVFHWVQWAKGCTLAQRLLSSFNPDDVAFQRYLDDINSQSADTLNVEASDDSVSIIKGIRSLQKKIEQSRFPERVELKEKLAIIKEQANEYPELQGFFAVASGKPASLDDVKWISKQGKPSESMTFVDFYNIGNALSFTYIRIERWGDWSDGSLALQPPDIDSLRTEKGGFRYSGWHEPVQIKGLTLNDVEEWKGSYLNTKELQRPSSLEAFARLTPLVKPILEVCDEGWLLVLSPNSVLNGIPMHAIPVGDSQGAGGPKVLLERNPVVYTPSMAAMRQCVARARPQNVEPAVGHTNAAFVGVDGSSERFYEQLKDVTNTISAELSYGEAVDKTRFRYKASTATNVFHFHGHQMNTDQPFVERYLQLGSSEKLNVRDISQIKFPERSSPLVTLMACSSAEERLVTGDEALGLVPLFLSAGASSVLGTLWSSDWPSTTTFSKHFYSAYKKNEEDDNGDLIDLARAVQKAALALKQENPAPYFWAPFVLTGSWFRRKSKARSSAATRPASS